MSFNPNDTVTVAHHDLVWAQTHGPRNETFVRGIRYWFVSNEGVVYASSLPDRSAPLVRVVSTPDPTLVAVHQDGSRTHKKERNMPTLNDAAQDLLARLREQNAANMAALAAMTTTPKENTMPTITPAVEAEHDFAAYDSSDIHLRTQEWEAQARKVAFIEFHAPAKIALTQAQHLAANDAMDAVAPGVRIGANVSQRKAHEILTSYIGLDSASALLANA